MQNWKIWYHCFDSESDQIENPSADVNLRDAAASNACSPDQLLGAYSFKELLKQSYCDACRCFHSERGTKRKLVTASCPSCQVEAFGSLLREKHGTCWRNCFDCPGCFSGLKWREMGSGYILRCSDCSWGSDTELNMVFASPSVDCGSLFDQKRAELQFFPAPIEPEFDSLLRKYTEMIEEERNNRQKLEVWEDSVAKSSYSPPNQQKAKRAAATQSLNVLRNSLTRSKSVSDNSDALELIDSLAETLQLPLTHTDAAGTFQSRALASLVRDADSKTESSSVAESAKEVNKREAAYFQYIFSSACRAFSDGIPNRTKLIPRFAKLCKKTNRVLFEPIANREPKSLEFRETAFPTDVIPYIELEPLDGCEVCIKFTNAGSAGQPMNVSLATSPANIDNGWFWAVRVSTPVFTLAEKQVFSVKAHVQREPLDLDAGISKSSSLIKHVWFPLHVSVNAFNVWLIVFFKLD